MRRAFTTLEVLLVVAILGALGWAAKPTLFPGASKRAAASTAATANVEAATNAQGSSAAASVTKIGEANAAAPASPTREFISREIPVALAKLPAPDPIALIEAERRRVAVMEGHLEEARHLYESAAKQAAELQRERDQAMAARRAVDLELEQTAAAEHARTLQAIGLSAVALLVGAAWLYARLYSISPTTLGRIAADVRSGAKPIDAMDTHLAPWLHHKVNRASRLATTPNDLNK